MSFFAHNFRKNLNFPQIPANLDPKMQNEKNQKKCLTNYPFMCIMCHVAEVSNTESEYGSIAQLGEHLPYKQEVTGSSPVVPTTTWPRGAVG